MNTKKKYCLISALITVLAVVISFCVLNFYSSKVYAADSTFVSTSTETFRMIKGYTIKLDEDGFAFRAVMDKDTYDNLSEDETVYFIIIPTDYAADIAEAGYNYRRAVKRFTTEANYGEFDKGSFGGTLYIKADVIDEGVVDIDGNEIDCYYLQAGVKGLLSLDYNSQSYFAVAAIEKKVDTRVGNSGSLKYEYTYAEGLDGVSHAYPETNLYDSVNNVMLYAATDYSDVLASAAYNWYGTVDYPVYIEDNTDYAALKDKWSTYSACATDWYFDVDGGVNISDGAIDDVSSKTIRTYTITIASNNGAYGSVNTSALYRIPAGTGIEIDGATLSIGNTDVMATATSSTAQYTYALGSWKTGGSDLPATVSADMTITANFTRTLNEYTITWKNYDGTNLATDTVAFGNTPVYGGAAPERADFLTKSFTYSGWDPVVAAVEGEQTYTATYDWEYRTDFGKSTGTNLDLATDLAFWQYANSLNDDNVTITKESAVTDAHATTYAFDALKYSRPNNTGENNRAPTGNMMYLAPEVIDRAVDLGYKWLTFYISAPNKPNTGSDATRMIVYNVNEDGSLHYAYNPETKKSESNVIYWTTAVNWSYFSIDLEDEKYHEGAGIGFGMYGKELYLAKVEFVGADISEYVSSAITATSGKTVDMVREDFIGKLFQTTDNTNNNIAYTASGSGKETANGGGDYLTFTRSGYTPDDSTINTIKLSSDWIQAMKKLGYSRIGIYIQGDGKVYKLYKRSVDGTNVYFYKNSSVWSSNKSAYEFIKIDLTDCNDGDCIVFVLKSGMTEFRITGLTFRTSTNTPSAEIYIPAS